MRFPGWANRRGSNGFSFGVFAKPSGRENRGDDIPHALLPESHLAEILRQAADLVLSDKNEGIVCGRKFRIGTSSKGARKIVLNTEWGTYTLTQKDADSCSLLVELPFFTKEEGEAGGFALPTATQEESNDITMAY